MDCAESGLELVDYEAGEAVEMLLAENRAPVVCPWEREEALAQDCRVDVEDPWEWCPTCVQNEIAKLQGIQSEREGGRQ
jgi:hypothetical protein